MSRCLAVSPLIPVAWQKSERHLRQPRRWRFFVVYARRGR